MKKLLVLLFVFVLFSCEKPKRYLDVEMGEIFVEINYSIIHFTVINNSDMDIYSKVEVNIDGTGEKHKQFDCICFKAREEKNLSVTVLGEAEDAKVRLKKCE